MGDLYHEDILEWSERQARLLRDLAAGRPGTRRYDRLLAIRSASAEALADRELLTDDDLYGRPACRLDYGRYLGADCRFAA